MSSHCSRYPGCGCSSVIGTKCHLKDDDSRLKDKEPEFSEEVEKRKVEELDKYNSVDGHHVKRRKPTNYTLPKKKRVKVKRH